MPTVLRFSGLRVSILTADHGPPHVHVKGNGGDAKFLLNCPDGPVELYETIGFKTGDLSNIESRLNKDLTLLCREWKKIHGN